MRLIARADDELYGVASVAAKLGRTDKLLDRLSSAAQSDPEDPEAAFAYALARMAMVQVDFDAHSRFSEIIDSLGQVLAIEPWHWLARYSRARLRALIPNSYGTLTVEVSGELGSAAEDLDDLLKYQAEADWQPYFASSHALAAVVGRLSGATDRCAAQLDALLDCPLAPVGLPVLGALLCEPLVTLHATSLEPERHRLGELMMALYGNQPVVARALGRQP
jgi:tetratricopeptide (TPR) repeat protein